MTIYDSIIDTIGNTPLVRVHGLTEGVEEAPEILAKLEFFNPYASVKDRIGAAMIHEAEQRGELRPGTTIVEPTSGNTGIALAFVAAAKGYPIVLTMPDSMSIERRKVLRALGASIVLTEGALGMKGAIAQAERLAEENADWYMPRQFDNPDNPAIHERTTGPEILRDTEGRLDYFVSGVGTGGTITGTSAALKSQLPELHVVAVEPSDSPVLSGGEPGPHKIQGIGAGFVPSILRRELIDEVIAVEGNDAIRTAREAAAREALMVGISAGAVLFAAAQIARRPEARGRRIVVMIPSFGERYLSTALFADLEDA